jgi:small-conductance mechanosensitive channel
MWEVEHDAWRFGVLLGSVVFALSFSTYLWRSRHAVRPAESDPADWAPSAAAWIWVAGAIGYVIGTLSMGTFALLLGSPFDPLRAAAGFLVLFLAAPYGTRLLTLWFATERLPAPAGPLPITITDPEDGSAMILTSREQPAAAGGTPSAKGPKAEALRRVLKDDRVLGRVIAIAVFVVALSLSALVVGVDLFSEATPYPIARLILSTLFNVGLVALIGYLAWLFAESWIDRKLLSERTKSAAAAPAGEAAAAPGTRLETVLPILRRTVRICILILAAMFILSGIGVNIAPLIAGAGIVGVAIGFGAQTLVKDVITGMFSLMDDAFRVGEYIEAGDAAGTVERFNARSIVLRGYLGAVYTVPYGELGAVTNYSRDWVIMKLRFRVPTDTDLVKVRKIFKAIGKDLAADPDLGPDLIEPFKSQGVIEVDDSAFVISGKFMTRPGRQFGVRKAAYEKVQTAFRENGIAFAPKRVIVDVPTAATVDAHQDDAVRAAAAHAS